MKEIILTTNGKLRENTVKAIEKTLAEKLSCENVRHVEDPSVIGGFTVKYDGTFYDLSVKTRLEQLKSYVFDQEAGK